MTVPFASLQALNSRRNSRPHPSPPQDIPPYYPHYNERPTPQSYNSYGSYAIPAHSNSPPIWQPHTPYPSPPHSHLFQPLPMPTPPRSSPPHAHLFQPLPMPAPPRYSERYPPPIYHLGEGHAAPTPYYTPSHIHPSASTQAWSDPYLMQFAAVLDERAGPVPERLDRPSEYDLSRRRVPPWDAGVYGSFEERFGRDPVREEVFLPYGEYDAETGRWRMPDSPERRRTRTRQRSHSHSYYHYHPSYEVTATPRTTHHASQLDVQKPSPPQAQWLVLPPSPSEKPVIPVPSRSSSFSSSTSGRRRCFLARLFCPKKPKKSVIQLPDVEPKDPFFGIESPQSSASSTMANFGSHGGIAEMDGRKGVRWASPEVGEKW